MLVAKLGRMYDMMCLTVCIDVIINMANASSSTNTIVETSLCINGHVGLIFKPWNTMHFHPYVTYKFRVGSCAFLP